MWLPSPDLTVECDNIPEAEVFTASDECQDIVVQYTETVIPGVCDNEYTLRREWIAEDDCGNASSHIQTIVVEDNTAPVVVSEASDLLVECDGEGNATELGPWLASGGGAVVTDNCGDITWSNNLAGYAVTCGGNAAITVRFTATDACGHTATTTATFTVVDTLDPEWNEELPPEYMEVECGFAPDAAVLTVTDNCGQIPVGFNETIGYAACPGNYTITRSPHVEDACGNLGVTHPSDSGDRHPSAGLDHPSPITRQNAATSIRSRTPSWWTTARRTPTSKCASTRCQVHAPTTLSSSAGL